MHGGGRGCCSTSLSRVTSASRLKAIEEELARAEAALTIEAGDERIGFREAPVVQANAADPSRRAEIERAVLTATDEGLGGHYRERIERQHACATELGWSSYAAMCEHCKGIDLRALAEQTATFAHDSAGSYPHVLEPELRRTLEIGFAELRRSDLPHFFRAPGLDRYFPSARLTESFEETMHGLGIDLTRQDGVTFDIETRPNKSPRAFCAPVRVPGEVYLVVAVRRGPRPRAAATATRDPRPDAGAGTHTSR
jgi:hypothetical protein